MYLQSILNESQEPEDGLADAMSQLTHLQVSGSLKLLERSTRRYLNIEKAPRSKLSGCSFTRKLKISLLLGRGSFDVFSRQAGDRGRVIRDRIVLPPMATELATEKGEVINALISHHRARDPDRGGTGMVIVEHSYVSDEGKRSKDQLGIHRDELIPGLRKLAKAIKDEGAVAIIQLNHAGAKAPPEIIGKRPVGPSSVPVPGGEVPRELSVAEIEEIIEKFVEASRRAMEAGFDGIEIHGAHGFLLSQFLSL